MVKEPAQLRRITDGREAEIDEQALQVLDGVRVAVHADDESLLTRRRAKERGERVRGPGLRRGRLGSRPREPKLVAQSPSIERNSPNPTGGMPLLRSSAQNT